MERMAWNDAMSVGAAIIDQDHRSLIDRLNTLDDAVVKADQSAMLDSFQSLFEAIARHFDREEKFLEAHRCPGLGRLRRRHEHLERDLADLRPAFHERLSSGDGAEVVGQLSRWLRDHILVEDMEYARFLNAKPPSSFRSHESATQPRRPRRLPVRRIAAL
jgi:hemerythrin